MATKDPEDMSICIGDSNSTSIAKELQIKNSVETTRLIKVKNT